MSDTIRTPDAQSVREDIAFMRTLAEEGAAGPLFGGSILLTIGIIYATASVVLWWILTRMPSQVGPLMWPLWGSAFTAHAVAMTVLILRLKSRGLGLSSTNRSSRVFGRTWNAIGMAIMACLASFSLTAWIGHMPQVFAGYPAVILALYGVGWAVTAAASNERWTWGVSLLSFAFAIASGALASNVNLSLLFAAALLLLLAAPGALLIRKASVRS